MGDDIELGQRMLLALDPVVNKATGPVTVECSKAVSQ